MDGNIDRNFHNVFKALQSIVKKNYFSFTGPWTKGLNKPVRTT